MTPEDPRHGSYAGAQAHASEGSDLCADCQDARRRYQKRLELDHARGRTRRTHPGAAVAHVKRLLEIDGITCGWIAERAGGISRNTVRRVISTNPGRMEASKVAAILAVQPPNQPRRNGYMPRFGVVRRLRALQAMGWTRDEIAARLDMHPERLTTLCTGSRGASASARPSRWVRASTWHAVNSLYAELHMTPGPSDLGRRMARAKGWPPPLAWDNIDDPAATPRGIDAVGPRLDPQRFDEAAIERVLAGDWKLPTSKREKAEICRRFIEAGGSGRQLALRTGWRIERYYRIGDAA